MRDSDPFSIEAADAAAAASQAGSRSASSARGPQAGKRASQSARQSSSTRVSGVSQPSLDLMGLMDAYGSEDRCRDILEELRWPDGPHCPKCESTKLSRIKDRAQFDCDSCGYQFSVTAGTIFHDSHLPIRKWFVATYLMTESRKGISANQIKRMLGIGSYRTAWYLCHRIRAAMAEVNPAPLTGIVETDETYIGGKPRRKAGMIVHGQGHLYDTKKRHEVGQAWYRNKTIVLGAVERGGKVRLAVVPKARKANVEGFLGRVVDDKAEAIYTDNFRSYDRVGDADTIHESVRHQDGEWVRGAVHTNTIESVWSLLDRSIIGAYHKLSVKHLPAYLQEFEWRYNNRENPYLFRDTLARLVAAEAMPYKALTA